MIQDFKVGDVVLMRTINGSEFGEVIGTSEFYSTLLVKFVDDDFEYEYSLRSVIKHYVLKEKQ